MAKTIPTPEPKRRKAVPYDAKSERQRKALERLVAERERNYVVQQEYPNGDVLVKIGSLLFFVTVDGKVLKEEPRRSDSPVHQPGELFQQYAAALAAAKEA